MVEEKKMNTDQACLHFRLSEAFTFHINRKYKNKNYAESTWRKLFLKEGIIEKENNK